MPRHVLAAGLAAATFMLAACERGPDGNANAPESPGAGNTTMGAGGRGTTEPGSRQPAPPAPGTTGGLGTSGLGMTGTFPSATPPPATAPAGSGNRTSSGGAAGQR